MIRVLHILWDGNSGGAQRFMRDIALYSDRTKFRHIVCFLSTGGWLADQIRSEGSDVYILEMKDGFSFQGAWRLFVLLRQIRPDLVQTHFRNYWSNIVLRFFTKVPKIYFEHGGDLLSPEPRKDVVFYNVFGCYYNLILANAQCVKDVIVRLTRAPAKLVEVFYIGIDADRFQKKASEGLRQSLGIPDGVQVVGIVGRLAEMKGLDDFIRIAAHIKSNFRKIPCVFLVVGTGPLDGVLKALARDLNVEVKFLGDRSDVADLLQLMDVFLFTSRWEPFGIVLLEAMASGIPVVGFLTHGPAEIAAKGGAISIEGRDITKAAEAVAGLLMDPARAQALGEEGRRNVRENFEIRACVAQLEQIYTRMLA